MRHVRPPKLSARGFALVEVLVVIVIIGLLAAAYFGFAGHKGKGKQEGKTTIGQAMDKGHSVECMNNLQQLRADLQMRSEDGKWPASLEGSVVSPKCPVSGQAYTYDPQTGTVKCPTPGHEKF